MEDSERVVREELPPIAYTVRHYEKRHETHKILREIMGSRSKSNKCLTTVTFAAEHEEAKELKIVSIEKDFLPRIKRFIQLKQQPQKYIFELASLLLRLPAHICYLTKSVNLPKPLGYKNKKTLVLDLDETLIHSCKNQTEGHVKIKFTGNYHIFINIRPYAQDLLKSASQDFEVIIFTASNKLYADAVLAHLDPTNKWVHHRLYRDSCIEHRGHHIKDLRIILNRDLKDVIIVDNSMTAFALQLDNGVPIHSWTEDLRDCQLRLLIDYLKVVKNTSDVRKINRDVFNLSRLVEEAARICDDN